ncbi:hypothetical protein MPTK1_3g00890 [Marchantia polymorpha subsp. ruderalis]|uniref:Uncharacterized protein n=2 Tax=Marchantia polymorpha TaxID=3197 RepID=A0AAF6AW23_MARPO|nr:hypothetical protein MARPO_0007s0085 [Marchantia polymorpha]BBN03957.1 hypothetical protein Mp_3g00890 [Marchantia polymorpha subsp. ruderalis]|eukprot:PTQ47645.1 hypothetical protein MARPO_0007s0085 [Marchantia polymorpha]
MGNSSEENFSGLQSTRLHLQQDVQLAGCSIDKSVPAAFVPVITPSFSRAAFSSSAVSTFASANVFPLRFAKQIFPLPSPLRDACFVAGVRRSSNSSSPGQPDELGRLKTAAKSYSLRGANVWGLGIAAGLTLYAVSWYFRGTLDEATEIEKQEKEAR